MHSVFLRATVSTLALAALTLAAAAQAQSTDAATEQTPRSDEAGEAIIVTGSALRNQETISQRREGLGIVDSISQDDTGDLADETVAEALIRLPGVNDMQTLYGEQTAKYISVRGISPDLNFVSFDGIGMFSAANDGAGSRRVDLALIPTQVARTTQVYKTFTPDLDGGVIGGATNIVPYSALDGEEIAYVNARIEYRPPSSDIYGGNSLGRYVDTPWGGSAKGLYVGTFGADDQFGVVASAIYNQESWTASKPNINGRIFRTATGATAASDLSNWDGNAALPNRVRPMNYTKYRQLFGGYLGFEYQAADTVRLSASVFNYKQIEHQTLNDFYVDSLASPVYHSPTTATLKIGVIRPWIDYDEFETEFRGSLLKGVWDIDGDTTLEVRGSYGLSTFDNFDEQVVYTYSPRNAFVDVDMSRPTPTFSFSDPADMIAIANYRGYSASDTYNDTDFESFEGRADLRHNYASNSLGLGFAGGFDARTVDAMRDQTVVNYVMPASPLGSIGFVPEEISFGFPYQTIYLDLAEFNDTVRPGLAVNPTSSRTNSYSSDYGYSETVLAAYAAGMYATDRTRMIAGVRYESVDYTADVPQRVGGVYDGTFAAYDGSYDYVLPSVNLTHDLTDELRLRAAYSKSLGRPAFSDIAQAELVDHEGLTIARGNPNLKPRKSNNFDLAAEHYFNGGNGLVSLGGFYKDIDDEIFRLRSQEEIDGQLYDVTQPLNATSASLKGIEFSFIDNGIAWLPDPLRDNLGVSLNVARMWAHMTFYAGETRTERDNLLFQPDWVVNTSVFYKLPGDGEIRVAYRWADRNLNTVNAQLHEDYVLKARGQLDLGLRYPINPHLIVKLEANNVLGEDYSMMHGYFSERYTLTQDRRFFLDVTWKL
jgi:TonB-dependent receptor